MENEIDRLKADRDYWKSEYIKLWATFEELRKDYKETCGVRELQTAFYDTMKRSFEDKDKELEENNKILEAENIKLNRQLALKNLIIEELKQGLGEAAEMARKL